MTQEEKVRAYDEALEKAKSMIDDLRKGEDILAVSNLESMFPELKESEDEQSRKWILEYLYDGLRRSDEQFKGQFKCAIAWLEKQGNFKSSKWTEGDVIRHGGILALVINGRKVMKSNCEQITIQYPDEWVKTGTKERKYFFEELEKQGEQNLIMAKSPQLGEQKPFDYEDANIQQKDFAPKSAMEAVKEKKIDNANKVEPKDYNSIDPHFGKPADKA